MLKKARLALPIWMAFYWSALCISSACGIRWDRPGSHFEGVDNQGNVFLIEALESLDVGDRLQFPLYALFKSSWGGKSPYLGRGWMLPLIESSIVQVDERTFLMRQPSGWVRTFYRSKIDPSLLDGGSWKAEIKGERVTAWAECGDKIVFQLGRIQSFTTKNRTFDIVYSGYRVVEIRESGATKLRVQWNDALSEAVALEFNGKRVGLELIDRPRLESLGSKNIVAGIDRSLGAIFGPTQQRRFEYPIDSNLVPTIISGDRRYSWSAADKKIVSDHEYRYKVSQGEDGRHYSAIERIDKKGNREYWLKDVFSGIETIEDSSGLKTVTRSFVRGILNGKKRKVEIYKGGKLIEWRSWAYDAKGRMFRREDSAGRFSMLKWDESKKTYEIIDGTNGVASVVSQYDERSKIKTRHQVGKRFTKYEVLPDGTSISTIYSLAKDGSESASKIAETRVFDEIGNIREIKIGDKHVIKYSIDQRGKIKSTFLNGRLYAETVYNQAGAVLSEWSEPLLMQASLQGR